MGPVLEQRPVPLQQSREMLAAERLVTRKQDQVMGALDRADRIHLHETDRLDKVEKPGLVHRPAGRRGQALSGEEDAPGFGVGNRFYHQATVERFGQNRNKCS